ncbi:MAG: PIN domain-containing protein [Blautia sp.]|uniref:PIN domain-containing protein n=1 Tax=Blautia sp. TaxID=1955243 RepID=UPI00262727C4|nr:PIN domain-containing protein [Blautia sp.]MDD6413008.1 PIN domain-containing protein [Blautia sp.]
MKNLFIDTNIWLSLYHFTNDDLNQFNKLKDMLDAEIRLFVPRQVKDEITRNREAKLNVYGKLKLSQMVN